LLVSFAKEPYERDYILQKRPIRQQCRMLSCTFITAKLMAHTHTHTHTHTHGTVDGMLGLSHAMYMNESCHMYMSHATYVT